MPINSSLTAIRNLLDIFSCIDADLERIQVNQHVTKRQKSTQLVQQTKDEDIQFFEASQEEADIIWPILLKYKFLNTVYSE